MGRSKMIKQATIEDRTAIEAILGDAVRWMKIRGLDNLWNEQNTKWEVLSKSYQIEDFYIAFEEGQPVGCMALTDVDQTYWPEVKKGEALYLHKLAVKGEARGKGISIALMNYAKEKAITENIQTIRLDCNANREKLRKLYEAQGFKWVRNVKNSSGYELALYSLELRA